MMPPVVAWVDPGKMTGIARLWRDNFLAEELPFDQAAWSLENLCGSCGPVLAIGYERYKIIPGVPQNHAHEAIEMIGVVKSAALRHGCRLLPPAWPGDRHTGSPDALRQLGWWVPGCDDAQSAAQHLLAWLLRTGNLPPFVAEVIGTVGGPG